MNQIKIGKFIAESRKSKNMTQEQMAEQLGVSNRTVSRWENGKNLPDPSLFIPICDLLDISISELFSGEKAEEEQIVDTAEKNIVSAMEYTEKKIKKIDRKLIVTVAAALIIILGLFVLFDRILFTPSPYYAGDVSQWQEQLPAHSSYQLALNDEGKPVFINPKKALKQAKVDYSDTIKIIKQQNNLLPISKYYYKPYGTYGWQITADDEMIIKQGIELSCFVDIYENSFE